MEALQAPSAQPQVCVQVSLGAGKPPATIYHQSNQQSLCHNHLNVNSRDIKYVVTQLTSITGDSVLHGRGGASTAAVLAARPPLLAPLGLVPVSAPRVPPPRVAAGAHHALRGAARVAQLAQTLSERHRVVVTVPRLHLRVHRAPQPLKSHLKKICTKYVFQKISGKKYPLLTSLR